MFWKIIRSLSFFFCLCRLHIFFLTQTLITLDLAWNEISDKGAENVAGALRNNKVSYMLFLSGVCTLNISQRHWSHLTSVRMKSETKERRFSLMRSKLTRWAQFSLSVFCSYLHFIIQTLTTLNLDRNKIDTKEATNISQRLGTRVVNLILFIYFVFACSFSNADSSLASPWW
jgi:hypothetical protein